jgi:hypothetical protein
VLLFILRDGLIACAPSRRRRPFGAKNPAHHPVKQKLSQDGSHASLSLCYFDKCHFRMEQPKTSINKVNKTIIMRWESAGVGSRGGRLNAVGPIPF